MSTFTPLQILNPSVADLDRAEELAREERLKGDNQQSLNAFKVAEIIKNSEFPVVSAHKGTSKFTHHLEEQERSRRLADRTEATSAITNAATVSSILKERRLAHVIPAHQGTNAHTRRLEEQERERRIADAREVVSRKQRASRVSDGIRVQGSTIRARLVNRKSTWQKSKDIASEAATHITDALPSADVIAIKATEVANNTVSTVTDAAHSLADTAAPAIAEATNAAKSAFSSLLSAASSVKDSIVGTYQQAQHAYYGDEELHENLASIKLLEEQERMRRMGGDSGLSRSNARMVSSLIMGASLSLKGSSGYIRYIASIVERERTRRLANKGESELREANACKVSRLLTILGWPFIHDAKSSPALSETYFLAEEERQRRLTDDLSAYYARYNACKVSAMIKDIYLPADISFVRGHIRNLEEKERRSRIKHADMATANARREAQLISALGFPFFVGAVAETTTRPAAQLTCSIEQERLSTSDLDRLEEAERQSRISEQEARRAAQTNARKVARMVSGQAKEKRSNSIFRQLAQQQAQSISYMIGHDFALLAENERKSRVNDKYMQQLAKANAYKVSSMIRRENLSKMAVSMAPVRSVAHTTALATPTAMVDTPTPPSAVPSTHAKPLPTPPVDTVATSNSVAAPRNLPQLPAVPVPALAAPLVQSKPSQPLSSLSTPVVAQPVLTQPAPGPAAMYTAPVLAQPANVWASSGTAVPVDASLTNRVRKIYDKELGLAEKENQRASDLRSKGGLFHNQRVRHHEQKAQKHLAVAQRHQEWLSAHGFSAPLATTAPVLARPAAF